MKLIAAPIILACIAVSFTLAQQPSAPANRPAPRPEGNDYTLSVTTQLVSIDVVVTDAKGNVVDGLTRDDFHVFEDKVPQKLSDFEAPAANSFPQNVEVHSTVELDKKAPNAPVTIIVLDEVSTKFEDEAFARYSVERFLKAQGDRLSQPTELVAVDFTGLQVLRDYTSSKADIENALNHHLQAYPWQLNAGWQQKQYQQVFNALNQVGKALAGHPGRKSVIWIGRGIPVINLDQMDPEDVAAIEDVIEQCVNRLRDARVALYTVDPAGIPVTVSADIDGNDTDTDPFGSSVDFNKMAQETGGIALYGRNDVDKLIGQSVRDGSHFYTMTYRPAENTDPNSFRRILVTVDRPGLTVTTREGYYTKPAVPSPPKTVALTKAESGVDLIAASENQMVYDGIPIEIRKGDKGNDEFIVHVPSSGLEWQTEADGSLTANLSLLVATFDRKGNLLHRDAKMIKVLGTTGVDAAVNLATHVDTAKAVRLRIVVRNTTSGKVGAQNMRCRDGLCSP